MLGDFVIDLVLFRPSQVRSGSICRKLQRWERPSPQTHGQFWLTSTTGKTRFNRLYLIGCTSTIFGRDALKAAIAEAKSGYDVQLYDEATTALNNFDPADPASTLDLGWIDSVKKQNKLKTDRLEAELKGYKNNLIKEAFR